MNDPATKPELLHCNYCGGVWDSGLFFGAVVPRKPDDANRLTTTCCGSCRASFTPGEHQSRVLAHAHPSDPAAEPLFCT